MKKKRNILTSCILKPLSVAYGTGMKLRNKMFDYGVLKQHEFDIPVIVVGNLSVGGTGKTPHTEYIIDALRYRFRLGVLSRGYRRKTKGFVYAGPSSTPALIGDEPYQIYRKFGKDVSVAVCEDRCRGIEEMRKIDPSINMILLDDAFQHRYVKPTVSIVLTEFSRPAFQDNLLPLGRLRESTFGFNRADIVVVTKCPVNIKPMEYRIFVKNLNLYPYQKLFFSNFSYGNLMPVFPDENIHPPYLNWLTDQDSILALAGIANPVPFVKHLRGFKAKVRHLIFPDHHDLGRNDIAVIRERFKTLPGDNKYIITTEKDAVKLMANPHYPRSLKSRTFYLPVKVEFLPYQPGTFDDTLLRMIDDHSHKTR